MGYRASANKGQSGILLKKAAIAKPHTIIKESINFAQNVQQHKVIWLIQLQTTFANAIWKIITPGTTRIMLAFAKLNTTSVKLESAYFAPLVKDTCRTLPAMERVPVTYRITIHGPQ